MNKITLRELSELSDKEQRQLKALINHDLGTLYAAQQRRKKVMEARMEMESELELDTEREVQDVPECE